MKDLDLATRLARLDERLSAEAFPVHLRPLECLKCIYGRLPDDELRRRRLDDIMQWYLRRYGDRIDWDGIVGRIPVIIRGDLYLVVTPFVTEDTLMPLKERIEGLPNEVADTFTPKEFEEAAARVGAATEALYKLYTLHVDDLLFEEPDRAMIRRAYFDLQNAPLTLKQNSDSQTAIFQSHQAAEKFLKVALRRARGANARQERGHDIRALFGALKALDARYEWLEEAVAALQAAAPNMDIRYTTVPRAIADAVSAYLAAVNFCGALAGMWVFEGERGSAEANFVPGRFYVDTARRTFFCKSLQEESAVLCLFIQDPFGDLLMMDVTLRLRDSSLYLEVRGESQIREMQAKYDFHLRNRGRQLTPEEAGIKQITGAEGSYVFAMRTKKVPEV